MGNKWTLQDPMIPEVKPIPPLILRTDTTSVTMDPTPNQVAPMDPEAPVAPMDQEDQEDLVVPEVPMDQEDRADPTTILSTSKNSYENS